MFINKLFKMSRKTMRDETTHQTPVVANERSGTITFKDTHQVLIWEKDIHQHRPLSGLKLMPLKALTERLNFFPLEEIKEFPTKNKKPMPLKKQREDTH